MDKSSFAKGGIRGLKTPFLGIDSRKGIFCFDVYLVISGQEFSRINSNYAFATIRVFLWLKLFHKGKETMKH